MLFGLAFLGLAACGAPPAPAAPEAAAPAAPHERLGRVVERYWDEHAISRQCHCRRNTWRIHWRWSAASWPRFSPFRAPAWTRTSRLTYDIFKRQRELEIEGFTYPDELLPVNPFDGMPWLQLAPIGSGYRAAPVAGRRRLRELAATDRRIRRLDAAGDRQHARGNAARLYLAALADASGRCRCSQRLGEDTSANVFYVPMRTLPQTMQEPRAVALDAEPRPVPSRTSCCPPIANCTISCKTNTCPRARDERRACRRCRWGRPGTHSWSNVRPTAR